jgi:hypothetical protein
MCDLCTPTGGPAPRPLSSYEGDSDRVQAVAQAMGLPKEVGDLAEKILTNGQVCDRCSVTIRGDDLMSMFSFVASTPMMATSSPPTIVCGDCGYRVAAFMGIEYAKRKVAEMGPDPVG